MAVHARHIPATRRAQAHVETAGHPAPGIVEHADTRILTGELLQLRLRVVGRTTVGKQELNRPVELLAQHRMHDLADRGTLIQHRHQHADVWR